MKPHPAAWTLAVSVWLLVASLWLSWSTIVLAAWLVVGLGGKKRRRRVVARGFVPFPTPAQVLGWFTSRRRTAGPRRMTSTEVARVRALLWHRDGPWCQECGRALRLDVHHSVDCHPEVHHLRAWSLHNHQPWVDHPLNLCLLCGPCNRRIGTGTTRNLAALTNRLMNGAAA